MSFYSFPSRWPRTLTLGIALVGLVVAGAMINGTAQARWFGSDKPLPEFANRSKAAWINSEPLKVADLKGKVVLIEIWTSV